MSQAVCYLITLLVYSVNGLISADSDDYIPTKVNCEMINFTTNSLQGVQTTNTVILELSWNLNHSIISDVRRYDICCNCTISGRHIERKKTDHRNPYSHQMTVDGISCYDKCHCKIRSVVRRLLNPEMDWSKVTTCHIGPTVIPRAPPVIISSPVRLNDKDLIGILFKLPPEILYCDSTDTDTIKSITVNVADHINGSHDPINGSRQYTYDQPTILRTDDGSYEFTFTVERHQFWRPFSITIAVNNSIGLSPFSDHMMIRGANNGDITRNDYDLEFCYDRKFNPKVTILYFYWNVSEKAENMLESHFITEFQIIIEPLQLNYSNSITHLTENMKIALNESLQPNQWYMTIGRMLTGDNDTWQPESVHKYFRTCESSKNQFDYSNNLTTDLMENKVITLNETLQLSQWYLVIGRILTIDNDTWGPESVYKYFETFPPDSSEHSSSSGNDCLLIIPLCFILFLTLLVVALLLYVARVHKILARLCYDDYDDDNSDESSTAKKMDEVIGITESYTDYPCEPSVVENASNDEFYSKKQDESTTDDLNSIINEYNSRVTTYRITAV